MNGPFRIGDYQVGTLASRAAARVLLSQRRSKLTRVQFFYSVRGPWRGEGPEPPDVPRANPWAESDGKLIRIVYVPHVWVARDTAAPICPDCGKPYRKATEYPNYPFVGYRADCVEKHIPDFSAS